MQMELRAIRAQLNPHFLFNTLNSIQHLISVNKSDEANEYISMFAGLMRKVLVNSEKVLIDYNNAVKLVEKSMEWPEHLGVGSPYIPDVRLENYIEAMCYEQMGNKDKATKLYESITKFTIENWKKWGSYHYISAIVLRKLGKNEQAKQLLKNWEKLNL